MILVPELLRLLLAAVARGWQAPKSLKFVAVGGASVAPELLERAAACGLPVYEGYGLSECTSVVALNSPSANRRGSAGRVLPHARVRIDEVGQIHVRGAVMLGYLGDAPGAAARPDGAAGAAATGGEVATGDLGHLDADGYLFVRGRVKNLLITSLGRNVSPEWVERALLARPEIGQVVVFGDARPYVTALVVPARAGLDAAAVDAAIDAANASLPDYARVRRWAWAPAPFTAADGSLTANGRPRREVLLARHAALIESLYTEALAS
jgi:long-subunit acyl-CoA synthetase (AMP-forming)